MGEGGLPHLAQKWNSKAFLKHYNGNSKMKGYFPIGGLSSEDFAFIAKTLSMPFT